MRCVCIRLGVAAAAFTALLAPTDDAATAAPTQAAFQVLAEDGPTNAPSNVVVGDKLCVALWHGGVVVTDGTAQGTRPVADAATGGALEGTSFLGAFAGRAYCAARIGGSFDDLWAVDPETAVAVRLTDFTSTGIFPRFTEFRGAGPERAIVYVRAAAYAHVEDAENAASIEGLWTTAGTAAGTRRLALDASLLLEANFSSSWSLANGAVFLRYDSTTPWRTDGTEAGTGPLPAGKGTPGNGSSFAVLDGRLYYQGRNNVWSTDGTPDDVRDEAYIFPPEPTRGLETIRLQATGPVLTYLRESHGKFYMDVIRGQASTGLDSLRWRRPRGWSPYDVSPYVAAVTGRTTYVCVFDDASREPVLKSVDRDGRIRSFRSPAGGPLRTRGVLPLGESGRAVFARDHELRVVDAKGIVARIRPPADDPRLRGAALSIVQLLGARAICVAEAPDTSSYLVSVELPVE